MATEPTCEQRIREYYKGRMETIGALIKAQSIDEVDELSEDELVLVENEMGTIAPDTSMEELSEKVQERIWEMPLSVEVIRTVKILLGTGGPGDWFEATVDDDGSIGRIEYHFNDWFDHASISVTDDADARAFCEQFTESALVTQ